MHAIKAIWTNGRLVPCEAIDWPDGCEVRVEPLPGVSDRPEKIGIDEAEWRDDPESLADWDAWIKTLEPLKLTPEEEARNTRFEEEMRRFNLDAVRRQMEFPSE